ncbi:MAG: hypothetical protein K9I82_01610 [Chitinophagaceae bacterium]|nr:hypothetical protein [Chitinophagaceae bacterium]
MKAKFTVTKEFDIEYLFVEAGVRRWDDGIMNGIEDKGGNIPCRDGDCWKPLININTGKIVNWKQGVRATTHYKVCDNGTYKLLDSNMELIKKIRDYVPKMLSPKAEGWGDYIIMDIDPDGQINDWKIILDEFYYE